MEIKGLQAMTRKWSVLARKIAMFEALYMLDILTYNEYSILCHKFSMEHNNKG